jgi:hypothetical protein
VHRPGRKGSRVAVGESVRWLGLVLLRLLYSQLLLPRDRRISPKILDTTVSTVYVYGAGYCWVRMKKTGTECSANFRWNWSLCSAGQCRDLRLTLIVILVANASGSATAVALPPVEFPAANAVPNAAADNNKDFMMCRSNQAYQYPQPNRGAVGQFIPKIPRSSPTPTLLRGYSSHTGLLYVHTRRFHS